MLSSNKVDGTVVTIIYAQKTSPTHQNLRYLWLGVCLAQKMGKGMA